MTKNFSAIAAFSGADNTGAGNPAEALEKIKAIMAKYEAGSLLSDEDYAIVSDSLPKIGCANTGVSSDGAFQGNDIVVYEAEGAGITVKVSSDLKCEGCLELDRNRMIWSIDMNFEKTGGDAHIRELALTYTFLSFGTDTASGKPKVMFNYAYDRTFTSDSFLVGSLDEGKSTNASHIDFTTNWQWAFCILATCSIRTDQGTLEV